MGFDFAGSGVPGVANAAAPASYLDKSSGVVWTNPGSGWQPPLQPSVDNIAAAGNSQATATVLPVALAVNVTTTPSGAGVLLPKAVAGMEISVNNVQNTAGGLKIYPNGTDIINGGGAGAAFTTAIGPIMTILVCFSNGAWWTK